MIKIIEIRHTCPEGKLRANLGNDQIAFMKGQISAVDNITWSLPIIAFTGEPISIAFCLLCGEELPSRLRDVTFEASQFPA